MKFSYKKIARGVLRPIIPIELAFQGKSIAYEVLVDSGADHCIFDAQISDLLGIDLESGIHAEVAGINGGPESYFIHRITLSVARQSYEMYCGFKRNFPKFGYGVVGQKGFFEYFVVKFDYAKEEIELFPRPTSRPN